MDRTFSDMMPHLSLFHENDTETLDRKRKKELTGQIAQEWRFGWI